MLWPLLVYAGAVLVLVAGILLVSYVLGPRHRDPETAEPYESGVVSTGSARVRLSIQFYLVAMFFVIFDVETVFLVAWAIAARDVGWSGYFEMVLFAVVLLAGLVYVWREGGLAWASQPSPPAQRPRPRGLPTAETPTRARAAPVGIQQSLPTPVPYAGMADGNSGPQRISLATGADHPQQ